MMKNISVMQLGLLRILNDFVTKALRALGLNVNSCVTRKNCQMSLQVAKNDFTRKMIDFDSFTKIA